MFKKFQGFILYVLITSFVAALYLDRHELLEKWDLKITDQMFRLRGKEAALTALRAQSIIVRDRSSEAGLDGAVRITIGLPAENDRLLDVLEKIDG